jgi:hypothetical protein
LTWIPVNVSDPTMIGVPTAPTTVAAGTVWTAIDHHYPDASLVARRQQDRSLTGPTELGTRFLDQLTDRQVEVLTAAYHAGYFEWPRAITGEDLAAEIDGYAVPRSAFSLYTVNDPGDPVVVAIDTVTKDLIRTDPSEVKRYEELYSRLSRAAWSVSESLEFVIRMAKKARP